MWDVVVVGGGPAGLVCSEKLASHGLEVLVLDDRAEPNMDKPCGGMLTERAISEFGVDERILEREIWGVTVVYREGEPFTVDYEERAGGNVHRKQCAGVTLRYLRPKRLKQGLLWGLMESTPWLEIF